MNDTAALRQFFYNVLIVAAAGMVAGKILSANFNLEPSLHRDAADPTDTRREWPKTRPNPVPTFSSNDRSRWATIRALVDDGTYAIGKREIIDSQTRAYKDSGITFEDGWGGVDKVLNPEPDPDNPNVYYFYSSKPPLLPTLLAGEYWLLKHGLGWTFQTHLFSIVRVMLLTVNLLPLILYWALLAKLVERFGSSDWGKLFVFTAGCFGTFLTTFSITLNNHTIAACTALYAVYLAVRIWDGGRAESAEPAPRFALGDFILCGLCAAFTATVELPALAFLVGLGALLLWRAPRPTLLGFLPPVLLVIAAGFLTNYLAIGRLTPAYAEVGSKSEWYLYQGSHWLEVPGKEKTGIDFAWKKENRAAYIFHFLFGHHGIFLLTPIFLLSIGGMVRVLFESRQPPTKNEEIAQPEAEGAQSWLQGLRDQPLLMVTVLTTYLTVVVVGFYLVKTNNYGGWSSGPRWVFWLTPFWLLTMLPLADRLANCRGCRVFALGLLGVSALSASFPAWNPWRMPWLYQWLDAYHLIPY